MSNSRKLLLPAKYNSQGQKKQVDKHAHNMVVKLSKEMAGAMYDTLMKKNEWYAEWQRKNPECTPKQLELRFIERTHGTLIEEARATLAQMLSIPSIDELTKEKIYESLLLDKTLTRGRVSNRELTQLSKDKMI